MIEFQLEDGISDNEALKLILSSKDESKSKENKSPNTNTFILDEESQTVDPFTYKLINIEVRIVNLQTAHIF